MDEIIKYFSNIPIGVFSVLAACITVGGGFFVWKHKQFVGASAVFRAAFADVLSRLRHSNTCPLDILNPAFPAHDAAVHEFGRFLGFKRKAFLRAWNQYAYHERQQNYPFLEQYDSAAQSISEQQRRRQLAIERLEHLLSFAKGA